MFRIALFFGSMILSLALAAETNSYYKFDTPIQEAQFEQLTHKLRCVVCQNQTIASSNAPLAKDLREVIYKKILAGDDASTINAYMVERYGDFILYQPPFNKYTLLLWFGPLALVVFICFALRKSIFFKGT